MAAAVSEGTRPGDGVISDAQLDEALHYLLDEADRDAQARADADYLREYLKVVKADLIRQQPGTSVAAATIVAESSTSYRQALERWRDASAEDYKRRFLRSAKDTLIEVWRSERANERAQRI
jgi:hypothetical protein